MVHSKEGGQHEERHATWLELFYDLAFVATIGQLGNALAGNFSLGTIGLFGLLFTAIWWGWVGQTFYLSRFDSGDLVHRLFSFLQIFIVVGMAIYIPAALEGDLRGFAVSYALLRATLVWQYLLEARHLAAARPLVRQYSIGFGLAFICWLVATMLPLPFAIALCLLGLVVDFLTPFIRPEVGIALPPDYGHFPERFGLFTIIVLGEGIIAAVAGLRRDALGTEAILAGLFGLTFFCCIWWVYFEGVRGTDIAQPRTAKELLRMRNWLFCHLPLTGAIVLSAIGFKKVMAFDPSKAVQPEIVYLIWGASVVVFLALHAIWIIGLDRRLHRIAHSLSTPHLGTTGLVLASGFFIPFFSPLLIAGICCAGAIAHTVLNIIERPGIRLLDEANKAALAGLPHEYGLFS